jgi:HAD superfamily hydrolase (TIGR01509 family)
MRNSDSLFSGVFFDMDGTLVDTEQTAARVLKQLFKEWAVEIDPNDASYIVGRTWSMCFDFLSSKYTIPLSREDLETVVMKRYHDYLEAEGFASVPGAIEAVKVLSRFGRLAVVSGSHRETIEWVLKKLKIRSYFERIFGAEDYTQSKPSPEPYLLAQKEMGMPAAQTWVFEDSAAGILSAKRAGHRVVAIECTNYLKHDQSMADHRILDLTVVNPEWVKAVLL